MPEVLTYPWDSKYPTSVNGFYSASGGTPLMPTDSLVTWGDGNRNEAGVNWEFQSETRLTTLGGIDDLYQSSTMGTQQGYGVTWTSTTQSNFNGKYWFDVGGMPNAIDAQSINNTTRSSWMKGVNSCWFVLSSQGTSTNNDCQASVVRTAIRYFNPNTSRVVILDCPTNIAGLRYNYGLYGGDSQTVCGYAISSANESVVNSMGYMFLGFRIMLYIGRNSSSTFRSDTINGTINGLSPGFGDLNNSYNPDARRILCRRGGTEYRNYQANKPYLEVA
jgi:hypothetical protein